MNKLKLLVIGASVYCGCLLISNLIDSKTIWLGVTAMPCAIIIFPVVYILNDLMTEVFGFKIARTVILTGFAINLIAVIAYTIAILLPGSPSFQNQTAFETVLGNTPRILVASFVAYLVGSILNAKVMEIMKLKYYDKLMARCILSTLIGESVDAIIFTTIGFVGTMDTLSLLIMIIASALLKTLYETVVYPITRKVILWARKLPTTNIQASNEDGAVAL